MTGPDVDIFDREKVFIEKVLKPLVQRLPQLKIVMEHITTMNAVKFVESCKEGIIFLKVLFYLWSMFCNFFHDQVPAKISH